MYNSACLESASGYLNSSHECAAYSTVNGAQESILITHSYCKQRAPAAIGCRITHHLHTTIETRVLANRTLTYLGY